MRERTLLCQKFIVQRTCLSAFKKSWDHGITICFPSWIRRTGCIYDFFPQICLQHQKRTMCIIISSWMSTSKNKSCPIWTVWNELPIFRIFLCWVTVFWWLSVFVASITTNKLVKNVNLMFSLHFQFNGPVQLNINLLTGLELLLITINPIWLIQKRCACMHMIKIVSRSFQFPDSVGLTNFELSMNPGERGNFVQYYFSNWPGVRIIHCHSCSFLSQWWPMGPCPTFGFKSCSFQPKMRLV